MPMGASFIYFDMSNTRSQLSKPATLRIEVRNDEDDDNIRKSYSGISCTSLIRLLS